MRNKMFSVTLAAFLVLSMALTACTPKPDWGTPDNPIVITFVPSGDTGKITTAGTQIADWLSKETGLSFKIEVGTSYAASIEAMGAQKAQMGFLATFAILLARQKYGIIPAVVAARKYKAPIEKEIDPDNALEGTLQTFYKSQFMTQADSSIKTFEDLKGKTFCFVDPNSTSGYILPNIILKSKGLNPEVDFKAIINAGGHDKVAISVYDKTCDAGVTWIDTRTDAQYALYETYPDIQTKVRVFAVSDRIPNDGAQFIKQLDPAVQKKITDALLKMAADENGKKFLKNLYGYDTLQAVEPTFYDDFAAVLKAAGVDPAALVK